MAEKQASSINEPSIFFQQQIKIRTRETIVHRSSIKTPRYYFNRPLSLSVIITLAFNNGNNFIKSSVESLVFLVDCFGCNATLDDNRGLPNDPAEINVAIFLDELGKIMVVEDEGGVKRVQNEHAYKLVRK
ncbi:hypothetical protein TcasGA2_TC006896 [Tribolium castaneum]|uniref:Uncharacterized protein n=1 Tax=Tribolium castaneum TaxID=7070 RepID=D7EII3_TRICA|nr:hypothetical protein TcasGA2_TC006896 [Tribolium castaneum]